MYGFSQSSRGEGAAAASKDCGLGQLQQPTWVPFEVGGKKKPQFLNSPPRNTHEMELMQEEEAGGQGRESSPAFGHASVAETGELGKEEQSLCAKWELLAFWEGVYSSVLVH